MFFLASPGASRSVGEPRPRRLNAGEPQGRRWFDASLTPSRSLKRIHLLVLCGLLIAPSILLGALLLRSGFGPYSGLVVIEAVIVLAILLWHDVRLSSVEERIILTDDRLLIFTSSDTSGPSSTLDAAWIRLERQRHPAVGLESLTLISRGRRAVVASVLSPAERADLADALDTAVQRRRDGLWLQQHNQHGPQQ